MTDPLLELKSLEDEIIGLLSRYKQIQMDYTTSITSGSKSSAGIDLQKLNELNGQILQKLDRAKTLALLIIPIETENQSEITRNIPNLKEKADSLSREKQMIDNLLERHYSIKGSNRTISLERQSNYYKYMSMFFVSILIIGITIRAYLTDSTSSAELFIIAIAALLIIYHLITYFL